MPTISVSPWPDPIIDTLGHDPRSEYVERFRLPTLGPTTLLLLRRLATTFDRHPESIELDAVELSGSLGLGARAGTSSPLMRSFERLTMFDLATSPTPSVYAVRRSVPPVNRRHLHRLPLRLQREHDGWVTDQLQTSALEHARQRARRVAFTLFEQGDDLDHVEHALLDIGFHPTVCRESAQWAHDRHRAAFAASRDQLAADAEEPTADRADDESTRDTAA
ncbi:MAG: hypothetical protein ACXVJF_19455 [Acidimicrobiia bacterium]